MAQTESQDIRFEPDEAPPTPLSIGLAFQLVVLTISGVVLTPVIVVQAANIGEPFLSWSIFCVLLIAGSTTILQAVRVWRFGSGHVLLMGTSGAFIAVCITALINGGPALMCSLIVVSSIVQFIIAFKLSVLRRIITPTVAGIVIMLIPVTVFPIIFDLLIDVPEEHLAFNAPIVAAITIAISVVLAMRATGFLRLWTPLIGLVIGTIVASFLGLFDATPIREAAWIGLPTWGWPGIDLSFGPKFWGLVPAFILVTVVGLVETIGDSVAIQRVSQRQPRAPDYRVVQGAVGADGIGNLLSGFLGTVPNTTYSSSIAVTELTGVASRRVGIYIGVIFLILAFLPKLKAVIIALPNPVAGAYITVILAMLFIVGMKLVFRDGLDFRKSIITGVSLWIGIGFQFELIFPDLLTGSGFWGTLLRNGMTVGGLVAIALTLMWEILGSRRRRIQTKLAIESLPELTEFLSAAARRWNWSEESVIRLQQVNEELLLTLIDSNEEATAEERRLQVSVRHDAGQIALEYVAAADEENIEDRAMFVHDAATDDASTDLSIKLLHFLAAEIRHQKYFDMDIVNIHVDPVT
ncbi:MAG: purine/pyrimidine permease [Gammaproteobacteria bacterium]|nr:purine/pyrimidine permease [Gammaproteobacteria bacterium]